MISVYDLALPHNASLSRCVGTPNVIFSFGVSRSTYLLCWLLGRLEHLEFVATKESMADDGPDSKSPPSRVCSLLTTLLDRSQRPLAGVIMCCTSIPPEQRVRSPLAHSPFFICGPVENVSLHHRRCSHIWHRLLPKWERSINLISLQTLPT